MIFDDLSLHMQILLGVIVPPILTLICWFGGRRLVKGPQPVVLQSKGGFWAMMLAAYILTALALYSSRYFAGTAHADDPSIQLIR
jgi:hypothetical protein